MIAVPKSPQGLLELFSLKGGQAPLAFGEVLTPVIDIESYYGWDRTLTAQGTAVVGGINSTVSDVFGSQATMLRSVGFAFTEGAAAGTFMHASINLHIAGTGVSTCIGAVQYGAIAAGASRRFGVLLPKPILLPPGANILTIFTGDAAGADHAFRQSWCITQLAP